MWSRAQVVAAVHSLAGVDEVAQGAESVDVAAYGARGDVESVGEFGAAPAALLEEFEQGQDAFGGAEVVAACWVHGVTLSEMADRCCPLGV